MSQPENTSSIRRATLLRSVSFPRDAKPPTTLQKQQPGSSREQRDRMTRSGSVTNPARKRRTKSKAKAKARTKSKTKPKPKPKTAAHAARKKEEADHARAAMAAKMPQFVPPPQERPLNGERLMSRSEVMDVIGVTSPTLWAWMRAGTFPRSVMMAGKSAWLASEIEAWLTKLPRSRLKGDAPISELQAEG
jgi:predicted DNA-binding transcriptional regulator AlpA